jgi:hypothetical protein
MATGIGSPEIREPKFRSERSNAVNFSATIQNLESDDVDSAIFWRTVRSNEHALPERDLMLAVLKDALLSFRKNLHNPNKLFKDDRTWFFQNDRDDLYSFESVCAVLGLSAHGIRRRLLAWENEAESKRRITALETGSQVSSYCSQ